MFDVLTATVGHFVCKIEDTQLVYDFSALNLYMQEYAICNRLHVSTNRGPSSFAMLSLVSMSSFGLCPRLTVITNSHTHTYTHTHTHILVFGVNRGP